jgi:hypothetical protein
LPGSRRWTGWRPTAHLLLFLAAETDRMAREILDRELAAREEAERKAARRAARRRHPRALHSVFRRSRPTPIPEADAR